MVVLLASAEKPAAVSSGDSGAGVGVEPPLPLVVWPRTMVICSCSSCASPESLVWPSSMPTISMGRLAAG